MASHPWDQVNNLGPKSRAGLMAYPELVPKVRPIATTTRPMRKGWRFDIGATLRVSMSAQISMSRIPVPIISSRNGPHQEFPKYGAGNVAKIEYVGSDLFRGMCAFASAESIAHR